jgi:hypothetical protein
MDRTVMRALAQQGTGAGGNAVFPGKEGGVKPEWKFPTPVQHVQHVAHGIERRHDARLGAAERRKSQGHELALKRSDVVMTKGQILREVLSAGDEILLIDPGRPAACDRARLVVDRFPEGSEFAK